MPRSVAVLAVAAPSSEKEDDKRKETQQKLGGNRGTLPPPVSGPPLDSVSGFARILVTPHMPIIGVVRSTIPASCIHRPRPAAANRIKPKPATFSDQVLVIDRTV
jgi:hypothetical protein